jgi:putative SOS response-associated peptidase YedK
MLFVEPNAMLKALPHHRMPAILRGADLDQWLDSSMTDADEAAKLCRTTPDQEIAGYFISKAINSGENNVPGILTPNGTFEEGNAIVSAWNTNFGY